MTVATANHAFADLVMRRQFEGDFHIRMTRFAKRRLWLLKHVFCVFVAVNTVTTNAANARFTMHRVLDAGQ